MWELGCPLPLRGSQSHSTNFLVSIIFPSKILVDAGLAHPCSYAYREAPVILAWVSSSSIEFSIGFLSKIIENYRGLDRRIQVFFNNACSVILEKTLCNEK